MVRTDFLVCSYSLEICYETLVFACLGLRTAKVLPSKVLSIATSILHSIFNDAEMKRVSRVSIGRQRI